MQTPEDVLKFWLDDLQPKDWYNSSPKLDRDILNRFGDTWKAATDGALGLWMTYPSGTLAYIILTDQMPRNMFRDTGKAFASDRMALAAAKAAVARKWDMRIDEPARQFFYLPMMHSESLADQEQAVRMFLTRMPETGQDNLLHAQAHRKVIRDFGRFPYRNKALDRKEISAETAYLKAGGYRSTVQQLQGELAA